MNDEELRQLVLASVRDVVTDPRRYGLVWRRIPATIVDGTNPAAVTLIVDGDTDAVTGVSLIGRTAGRVMVDVVPPSGMYIIGRIDADSYTFAETLIFDADDTLETTDYPGLTAVRVRMVGGGGAGGGAAANVAGNASLGGGGGGGGYAESFVPVASLSGTSVAIVVGQGGAGVSATTGNNGTDSTFDGTLVVADGGIGGTTRATSNLAFGVPGSGGGTANTGDLIIAGGGGGSGWGDGQFSISGQGGASQLGGMAIGLRTQASTQSLTGTAGLLYGGGGSGAATSGGGAAAVGGAGADGIVLVDVYV